MRSELNGCLDSVSYDDNEYGVIAGVIIGAHGVQGAAKIKLATGTALNLIRPNRQASSGLTPVWIGSQPKPNTDPASPDDTLDGSFYLVKQVKELQPGGRVLLLKLQNITERNQVEALIGRTVYAPKERRAQLADGEYFTEDLIGLQVVTDTGRKFGKLTAVLQQPGNDVYETAAGALVPAVKSVILSVDLVARTMTVVDVPGLLPEEADELRGEVDDTDAGSGGEPLSIEE